MMARKVGIVDKINFKAKHLFWHGSDVLFECTPFPPSPHPNNFKLLGHFCHVS